MERLLIGLSKYILLFLMLIYTSVSFFANRGEPSKNRGKYIAQNILMMLMFTICSVILLSYNFNLLGMIVFVFEFIYLILLVSLYRFIYPNCSVALVNNMAMMLAMGFVMVERLSPNNAFKQFFIVLLATVVSFFVPKLMRKRRLLIRLKYVFAVTGLFLLSVTLILGKFTWGAKISVDIAGFTFQPSEFVKLIYVIFVAAMLSKAKEFKNVIISAIISALHVLILVASTDLGAALIFFVVYINMLFIGTGKLRYLFAGLGTGAGAAVVAYSAFSHVKTRVAAWRDPWSIINGGGYQITQSLFAIGTGGLFGLGLYQGAPNKIPVAVKDFVFSAICEEFGALFGICIIMVCFCSYISIMSYAAKSQDKFYKLIAVGFGTLYVFQCFLTIGGVTKFIPSTGVTLPFVSYGGSSVLCSLLMFAMIQAVFILVKENEVDEQEEQEEQVQ